MLLHTKKKVWLLRCMSNNTVFIIYTITTLTPHLHHQHHSCCIEILFFSFIFIFIYILFFYCLKQNFSSPRVVAILLFAQTQEKMSFSKQNVSYTHVGSNSSPFFLQSLPISEFKATQNPTDAQNTHIKNIPHG